jgi:hypothetical protein
MLNFVEQGELARIIALAHINDSLQLLNYPSITEFSDLEEFYALDLQPIPAISHYDPVIEHLVIRFLRNCVIPSEPRVTDDTLIETAFSERRAVEEILGPGEFNELWEISQLDIRPLMGLGLVDPFAQVGSCNEMIMRIFDELRLPFVFNRAQRSFMDDVLLENFDDIMESLSLVNVSPLAEFSDSRIDLFFEYGRNPAVRSLIVFDVNRSGRLFVVGLDWDEPNAAVERLLQLIVVGPPFDDLIELSELHLEPLECPPLDPLCHYGGGIPGQLIFSFFDALMLPLSQNIPSDDTIALIAELPLPDYQPPILPGFWEAFDGFEPKDLQIYLNNRITTTVVMDEFRNLHVGSLFIPNILDDSIVDELLNLPAYDDLSIFGRPEFQFFCAFDPFHRKIDFSVAPPVEIFIPDVLPIVPNEFSARALDHISASCSPIGFLDFPLTYLRPLQRFKAPDEEYIDLQDFVYALLLCILRHDIFPVLPMRDELLLSREIADKIMEPFICESAWLRGICDFSAADLSFINMSEVPSLVTPNDVTLKVLWDDVLQIMPLGSPNVPRRTMDQLIDSMVVGSEDSDDDF